MDASRATDRDDREFEEFFRSSYGGLFAFVARRVAGTAVDPEDVLQDGFVKIAREFAGWPRAQRDRERYATRVMRGVAVDAIRSRHGRHRQPVCEVSLDGLDADSGSSDRTLARAHVPAARQPDAVADCDGVIALLRCLSRTEQRVLLMTVAGFDHATIARELGMSVQRSREVLHETRQLIAGLLTHQSGEVGAHDRERLRLLAEGRLPWRAARLTRRHLAICHACQKLAEGAGFDGDRGGAVRVTRST